MIFSSKKDTVEYLENLLKDSVEIDYYKLLFILKRNSIVVRDTIFIDKEERNNLSVVSIESYEDESVKVHVNMKSWVEYLPEIYQENEFLKRFLYGFQVTSIKQQMIIDNIEKLVDPASTEFIDWLSSWFGISFNRKTDEISKRKILSNALKLYKKRGTKEYLKEMIDVLTGIEVSIKDDYKYGSYFDKKKSEFSQNHFVVHIREKILENEQEKLELISSIINQEKPANTIGFIQYRFSTFANSSEDEQIIDFNSEYHNYDYDKLDG